MFLVHSNDGDELSDIFEQDDRRLAYDLGIDPAILFFVGEKDLDLREGACKHCLFRLSEEVLFFNTVFDADGLDRVWTFFFLLLLRLIRQSVRPFLARQIIATHP